MITKYHVWKSQKGPELVVFYSDFYDTFRNEQI